MRLLQCFCVALGRSYLGFFTPLRFIFSLPAGLFAMQQTSAADFLISLFSFVSHFHMWEFLSLQHSKIYISHKSGCELLAFLPSSWRAELSPSCNMLLSQWNERNEKSSRKFFHSSPTIFAGSSSLFLLRISSRFSSTIWKFTRFCSHSSLRNSNQERKNCKCMQHRRA